MSQLSKRITALISVHPDLEWALCIFVGNSKRSRAEPSPRATFPATPQLGTIFLTPYAPTTTPPPFATRLSL